MEGLEIRWDIDVIDEKPEWLSVKIGINNASRQYAEGVSTSRLSADVGGLLSTDSHTCEN